MCCDAKYKLSLKSVSFWGLSSFDTSEHTFKQLVRCTIYKGGGCRSSSFDSLRLWGRPDGPVLVYSVSCGRRVLVAAMYSASDL